MLEAEDLFSLDALLWLQSGERAGAFLSANQSTISRRTRDCLNRLELSLEHCAPGPSEQPMQTLLRMERQLHQLHRFRGRAPLRLFANYWVRKRLLEPLPPGWIAPPPDPVRPHPDPLGLLEAHIVDAALLSGPEVRGLDPRQWRVVDISCLPLEILAPSDHPLVWEQGLRGADLATLSPLSFAAIVPQAVRQVMESLYGSLGGEQAQDAPGLRRGNPGMATPFTRHLWPRHRRLDVSIPTLATDHMVVLADLPWEARLDGLLLHLSGQLRCLQPEAPGLLCLIP